MQQRRGIWQPEPMPFGGFRGDIDGHCEFNSGVNAFYLLPCGYLSREPLRWRGNRGRGQDPLIRERKSPAGLVSRNPGCEQDTFKLGLGRRRKDKTKKVEREKKKKKDDGGRDNSRVEDQRVREGWRVEEQRRGCG